MYIQAHLDRTCTCLSSYTCRSAEQVVLCVYVSRYRPTCLVVESDHDLYRGGFGLISGPWPVVDWHRRKGGLSSRSVNWSGP